MVVTYKNELKQQQLLDMFLINLLVQTQKVKYRKYSQCKQLLQNQMQAGLLYVTPQSSKDIVQ